MGTNYYAKIKPCDHCGVSKEELHIGKSSGGWKFLFAPYPEHNLTTWKAWLRYLLSKDVTIRDEYGQDIHIDDFYDLVEANQRPENLDAGNASEAQWGSPMNGRDRYETKDDAGYRFARDPEFS